MTLAKRKAPRAGKLAHTQRATVGCRAEAHEDVSVV